MELELITSLGVDECWDPSAQYLKSQHWHPVNLALSKLCPALCSTIKWCAILKSKVDYHKIYSVWEPPISIPFSVSVMVSVRPDFEGSGAGPPSWGSSGCNSWSSLISSTRGCARLLHTPPPPPLPKRGGGGKSNPLLLIGRLFLQGVIYRCWVLSMDGSKKIGFCFPGAKCLCMMTRQSVPYK